MFVNHEGDFFRTRLTHSIEVAQIARSIARELGLDEDLTEALALAHDLGHPPFGHAGEEALNLAMKPFGGFDHNAQSLRVVTLLESRYAGWDGLNLTWETLEGLAKHNGPLRNPPAYIAEYNERHRLELGTHASAEAQVAALADDIAYHSHDLDDGLRARLFGPEEIAHLPVVGEALAAARHVQPGRAAAAAAARDDPAGDRRDGDRPDRRDAAAAGQAGRRAMPMRCGEAKQKVVAFSPPIAEANQVIKDFLSARMYRHWRVNRMTTKARVLTERAVPAAACGHVAAAGRLARAGRGVGHAARGERRWRLYCGHDGPLCDGRTPAADRSVGERDDAVPQRTAAASGRNDMRWPHRGRPLRGERTAMTADMYAPMRDDSAERAAALRSPCAEEIAARIEVTPPRDPSHGDMTTNAAMVAAKSARQPPAKLAAAIVDICATDRGIAEAMSPARGSSICA